MGWIISIGLFCSYFMFAAEKDVILIASALFAIAGAISFAADKLSKK